MKYYSQISSRVISELELLRMHREILKGGKIWSTERIHLGIAVLQRLSCRGIDALYGIAIRIFILSKRCNTYNVLTSNEAESSREKEEIKN